jgi:hypothetical protein
MHRHPVVWAVPLLALVATVAWVCNGSFYDIAVNSDPQGDVQLDEWKRTTAIFHHTTGLLYLPPPRCVAVRTVDDRAVRTGRDRRTGADRRLGKRGQYRTAGKRHGLRGDAEPAGRSLRGWAYSDGFDAARAGPTTAWPAGHRPLSTSRRSTTPNVDGSPSTSIACAPPAST